MKRRRRMLEGLALVGLGLLVSIKPLAVILQGLPTYANHYSQPVSAHVALAIGVAMVGFGLWRILRPPVAKERKRRRRRQRESPGQAISATEITNRGLRGRK